MNLGYLADSKLTPESCTPLYTWLMGKEGEGVMTYTVFCFTYTYLCVTVYLLMLQSKSNTACLVNVFHNYILWNCCQLLECLLNCLSRSDCNCAPPCHMLLHGWYIMLPLTLLLDSRLFITDVNNPKPVIVVRQFNLISTCGLLCLFYRSLINKVTSGF